MVFYRASGVTSSAAMVMALSAMCFAAPAMAEDAAPSASTGKAMTDAEAAAAFGQRPGIESMRLSPDGTKVMAISAAQGLMTVVRYADLSGGGFHNVTASKGDSGTIQWCNFVSNQRILCDFFYQTKLDGEFLGSSRLLALDIDGQNGLQLGERSNFREMSIRQDTGYVIDWVPTEPDTILLAQTYVKTGGDLQTKINRTEEGLGVVQLDTRTNKSKRVVSPSPTAEYYLGDGQGNVRMAAFSTPRTPTGYSTGRVRFMYRLPGESKWLPFSTYADPKYAIETEEGDSSFSPWVVDGKKNVVYGLENTNGRVAAYTISLDGNFTKKLVFAHPKVDVDGLETFGRTGRVIGVSYTDDKTRAEYFDEELKTLRRNLTDALPGNPSISFIDASLDEKILLILASSDNDPGRYYVFDRNTNQLREIALKRPTLEAVRLSTVEPMQYAAADGTMIPGYLTLPPGKTRADAKNLPAIVMPHGGPESRDTWGFDWLAQFFANRGYAVLQPNFRGSTGYGDDWFLENGYRSWETAIGDITDGGRWMVKSGLANPSKLAIVGWSYGGYAALQSSVVAPELFKAVAAIAPVTDLQMNVAESRAFTNYKMEQERMGKGDHIQTGSPLRRASEISVPVIIFHGDMDANVGVEQSREMRDALQKLGKKVEYHEYPKLDHQLDDSNVRAEMLLAIEKHLEAAMN